MSEARDDSGQPDAGSEPAALPYAEDGVDVTLIREMLALTPSERLELLRDSIAALDELLSAVKAN